MYVPFSGSRLSQFEGYEDLDELDWSALRQRYDDIRRLDRLLEAEGRSVNDVRASKQADVLMLLYVLSVDELADVLSGLGYDLHRSAVPEMVDFYLARTSHGSTLSSLVHSWVLTRSRRDRRTEALELLLDVVHSDVDDVQGGTTGEGVHLAAMCGGADLLLRCFAGLEPRLDSLEVSPEWPDGLGELRCHLRYQGHELDVVVGPRRVRIESCSGPAAPVVVRCRGQEHVLAAGQTVEVAWLPMATESAG
jgi:trehalose/maltose hydrolase-like predicted phosphorylase